MEWKSRRIQDGVLVRLQSGDTVVVVLRRVSGDFESEDIRSHCHCAKMKATEFEQAAKPHLFLASG